MKAQLGKPTGLALALLATLLATFLAMGVFSVAQANEHSATRSFSATTVAPGGEVTVNITLSEYGEGGSVAETLPQGFSLVSGSVELVGGGGFVRPSGNQVRVILAGAGVTNVAYKVTAPSEVGGPFTFTGNFVNFGGESVDIAGVPGATMVTVAAAAIGGNGETESGIELNTQEPGAAVQITITDSADPAILPDEQIEMDLSGFSVPETIADSDISISSEGYRGNPSNVVVNGSTVTMTVPNVKANGDDQRESVRGDYTIRIKQSAGVTNAASGGEKTVSWQENSPDGAEKEATVNINRVIKLSETSGTRGTMTTATFKGFANGSATVFLNDPNRDDPDIGPDASSKHGEVMITDNTGTLEIDTTSSNFKANQDNVITATDAAGNSQNVSATLTISAKAVVDPEESPVSKEVTINLSDWPATNAVTKVTIGSSDVTPSTAVTTDDDGSAEFEVMVPAGANRGTQTVKVTGSESAEGADDAPSATASLSVGVLALTIQPGMVVPGQQITIEGSGFVSGDKISSVKIGNQTAGVVATANSAGDIVIAVDVPSDENGDGIGSGKKTVSVTAIGSGRVAEGSIEIPKAVITLDPVTSRRGTIVNASGSGFPSRDLVQVSYEIGGNLRPAGIGTADASGAVDIDFQVPTDARIGSKHNVEATSSGRFKGVTAKATHETPGAMVTLSSDSISSGENITIAGVNFPAFATVAVMEIGGVDVRPVPAPATSIDGDFESNVLVPQLRLGNQTVKVRVSSTTITTFLELATATVSRAPADVFASLGDRLVRVWYLERSTQVWSFYDPDPDVAAFNTLTEVSSGQNVSIIISSGANIGFQDKTLYPGTNPIALD
jgi:hypothetical protein